MNCSEKDKEFLLKQYSSYQLDPSYSVEQICHVLSNYLEPNTLRVIWVLTKSRIGSLSDLHDILQREKLVVRIDGFQDNDELSIKRLYNIIMTTKSYYLYDTLNYEKVYVSLVKLTNNDNVYNFIRNWSKTYIYFEKLEIPYNVYNDLKLTIKQPRYTLYRGLNFTKKDLQSFFNKDVKYNVTYKEEGEEYNMNKIHLDKFTSWSSDMDVAASFARRINRNIKNSKKTYMVILATIVTSEVVLADLHDYDPVYRQNEVILRPGSYNVLVYFADKKTNKFTENAKVFDTMAEI